MIDREKVIKALECRKNADKRCGNPCEELGTCYCYYATAVRGLDGEIYKPFVCDRERICADALALLKEQEAVTIKKTKEHGFGVYGGICPKCRNWIQSAHSFCGFCGKAVKWE